MTRKTTLTLAAQTLTSLPAAAAQAGTLRNERRGRIVGFDFGTGSSLVEGIGRTDHLSPTRVPLEPVALS